MDFLRSVITDARPRKPMRESSDVTSEITGWKTRGLDGDNFKIEEKSPSAADQTSRLSNSMPIQEGAIDVHMGDAPAFQADNPVNQDIQDIRSNVEPERPLSMPVEKLGPIPDEESSSHPDTRNLPDQEPESEGGEASETERNITQQPAGTIIPDSRMNALEGQDHHPTTTSSETRGAQNEEAEPARFPTSVRDMPGKELIDNDANSPLQAEEVTAQVGVDETLLLRAEGNALAQGEAAGADDRRHSDSSIKDPEGLTIQADLEQTTALTPPESSRRIESSVLKASLVPPVPSPDASENPTLDTAVAAKGALRDVQLVSRRAMAVDPHISSDMELATDPQSAGKEVSTSASSRRSGSSKPGSPVQHITRPAKPSASPEALRSVPARPYQEDLMPKDGGAFHSKAPLRTLEKEHEVPKVQIGQIDVIIEAAAQSAAKPAPATSPIDLASRHYLRGL